MKRAKQTFYALCSDGKLKVIGDFNTYENADYASAAMGLEVIWLVTNEEANQWANTINSHNSKKNDLK